LSYQLLVDHGVTHSYNGYRPPVAVRRHRIDLDHLGTQLRHGRHSSLNQSEPELLESWKVHNKSILFVDDGIISDTTAKLCYKALVALGKHVDGLIWVYAGG
jgi:hypothetical protein